jgi:hypothetical protein
MLVVLSPSVTPESHANFSNTKSLTDPTPVTISAITTTNVTSLTFGPSAVLQQVKLAPIGPGKWQSTFTIDATRFPASSGSVNEILTATTESGSSSTLRIPVSLAP